MSDDKFTIVGDGKYLAMIHGENAYVFEGYLLKEFNISHNYQAWSTADFSIIFGKSECVPADTIKINNVENMSIFELFKAINDKIEKRNDKT